MRGARFVGGLLAAMVLLLAVRLVREGARLADDGDAAAQRRDELAARRCYEQALRAYVPLAPHMSRAVAGLEALAREARREGRTDDERATLSSLRAGLLGARSFYLPHAAAAAWASERLAVLTGTPTSLWWPPLGPRSWALALGFAGLGVMLFALLRLGPRALSPRLQAKTRTAVAMSLTFTVGLVLFIVGMRLA